MRWWYRLTFVESNQLVDGVGCPGNRVIDSNYRYWHDIDSAPCCILISVTRPADLSAILADLHVTAALIRSLPRCRAIVTVVADLTLSAVHQWVGH